MYCGFFLRFVLGGVVGVFIINTFIYSCVAELDDDVGGVGKVGDTQGIRKRVWSPALVQNLFTLLTILHLLSDLISDWII